MNSGSTKVSGGVFLLIPFSLVFLALTPIILPLVKVIKGQWYYSSEEHTEWGCPDLFPELLYGAIGHAPCGTATGKSFPISDNYRQLPDVEEIHQTDRTVEKRHPLPRSWCRSRW